MERRNFIAFIGGAAMTWPLVARAQQPVIPLIGILGSGFIVNDCHLVAYRKAGFNPVAIASRNGQHAQEVAKRSLFQIRQRLDEWPEFARVQRHATMNRNEFIRQINGVNQNQSTNDFGAIRSRSAHRPSEALLKPKATAKLPP